MKVETILHNLITDVTPKMHKVRRKSLEAMVISLVSGADLQVTSLGRNIESDTSEKYQIKFTIKNKQLIFQFKDWVLAYNKIQKLMMELDEI